ncbi:MAG: hypothetical protein WBD31_30220 [Rubripirellula sp.]
MNFTADDVTHFSQHFLPLTHDTNATRLLHLQAGSFYWTDEIPSFIDDGYPTSIRQFTMYLLSYRKVLMHGENVPEFAPLWLRLQELCPAWPGFLADRMDRALIQELDQALDHELDRLERYFSICKRRKERNNSADPASTPPSSNT